MDPTLISCTQLCLRILAWLRATIVVVKAQFVCSVNCRGRPWVFISIGRNVDIIHRSIHRFLMNYKLWQKNMLKGWIKACYFFFKGEEVSLSTAAAAIGRSRHGFINRRVDMLRLLPDKNTKNHVMNINAIMNTYNGR